MLCNSRLGANGNVVSGREESGQAEVRRCDEFIVPSLCATKSARKQIYAGNRRHTAAARRPQL